MTKSAKMESAKFPRSEDYAGTWEEIETGVMVRVDLLAHTAYGLKVGYRRIDGKGRYEILADTFHKEFKRVQSSESK